MREILQTRFGHADFRPGQREVVERLMDGKPVLAVFPTGGGKSLCYQLPALATEGLALVVSPLIALMRDQVGSLLDRGIPAARLDSTLDPATEETTLASLDAGEIKLLYVAPERFANETFRRSLKRWNPSLAAIDEAHCMIEWGHNFRPDYLKLARVIRRMRIPRVLALTATATPPVAREIRRFFRIAADDEVRLPFHRPNLDLRVTPLSGTDARKAALLRRLESIDGPAIVYVTRQDTAAEIATFLKSRGLSARAYHAGLRADFRARAQQSFMDGGTRVIVATIAFGMGIDKSDIRAVIHYNLPKSPENLVQETGRAGRDGRPATCEILANPGDLTALENFIHADVPGRPALANMLDRVLGPAGTVEFSIHELSVSCDIRRTVVETILAHLETEGLLSPAGRRHTSWRVRLLRSEPAILAGRPRAEACRLRNLLTTAARGRGRLAIDANTCDEPRAADLLRDLELAGDAVVEPRRIVHRFRRKKTNRDAQSIIRTIADRFDRREREDLARTDRIMRYLNHPGCLTAWLASHFGADSPPDCGNCDRCRGIPPAPVQRPPARGISNDELTAVHNLVRARHPSLGTARQLARFLCGMPSPATRAARLLHDENHGRLEGVPFPDVLILTRAILNQ